MRAMAVDFGRKRIGIAVGVDSPLASSAKPNLAPSGTLRKDAESIVQLAREHEAEAVVVGIPVSPSDPAMERICRMLASHIRELGTPVHEVDESRSSVEAEQNLGATGWNARRRARMKDGEAARILLERFFAQT